MLETAVLATSRELYDNADSGNIHSGNMKLAYDWWGYQLTCYQKQYD